jgi:hypothetical protein
MSTEIETVFIPTTCTLCGKSDRIEVLRGDYDRWRAGAFVQVAFPEMPKERREQLISGTCPPCWERLFAYEDD